MRCCIRSISSAKEGFDVTLLDVHENGVVRVEDGRGHPGGHGARVRHVCQQRDRHHPAHPCHRRTLPRTGHPVPHGCGAGHWPRSRECTGDEYRPALVLGAQVPRPARRRLSVCQARHPAHEHHRGRRAGERGKRGGTENPQPSPAWPQRCARRSTTWPRTRRKSRACARRSLRAFRPSSTPGSTATASSACPAP